MPRDRLDGIKTKEGRVIYDRKEHPFTLKDARRIVKKIGALPLDIFPELIEESVPLGAIAADTLEDLLNSLYGTIVKKEDPMQILDGAVGVLRLGSLFATKVLEWVGKDLPDPVDYLSLGD